MFNSTLIIVNYDENDGQFDHVPPPVPAPGEKDEFVSGTDLSQYGLTGPAPVGLGFRVPEHQCLAAPGLRRPHRRLRLLQSGLRCA